MGKRLSFLHRQSFVFIAVTKSRNHFLFPVPFFSASLLHDSVPVKGNHRQIMRHTLECSPFLGAGPIS